MNLDQLTVWQLSRSLRIAVSDIANRFPQHEKFELKKQIIRSSRSISANIAEGHGRYHFQENIQFCRQARGSLIETYDHLTVARDEGYIDSNTLTSFEGRIEELEKVINGYISYLKRRKKDTS